MNKHIKTLNFFEENSTINAINFDRLQRELINTLSYASVRQQKYGMFGIHNSSIRHYKKLLTMKTTKNTGKNQKNARKVREECQSPLNYKLFSENILYD